MKQIIPFQKELLFNTKVSEITSISLDYSISSKNDDVIEGVFKVSGEYKMTEGSINREEFNFDIPFEIRLDGKYDSDSIKIDIDNFYYEVVNEEILKVNIDVYLIGDEVKREVIEIKDDEEEGSYEEDASIKYNDTVKTEVINNNNIFNSFDSGDTYVTYFVYVVKENDTLDNIMEKFGVKSEELEKYNDLSNFHEKMKLIIPSKNE